MNRRGFLKAVGGISGSIYVPEFKLQIPEAAIPTGASWFASARELIVNDIRTGKYIMRHDILGSSVQLFVTQRVSRQDISNGVIVYAREVAEQELWKGMQKHKIKISDLKPLEIPLGVEVPKELEKYL